MLQDELRALLDLARTAPPTAAELRAHYAPRAREIRLAGPNLEYPAWADGVRSADDIYIELGDDIIGVHLWDDSRGWGAYAELAVARGTVGDVEAVVGALREPPRAPGNFGEGTVVAATPEIAGHRVRVFARHVDGAVKRVTVHFER